MPVFERLGNVRLRAVALGKVADILQARGQLNEALRIRQEEQLPVYERLGDVREHAVTLGNVADILQARGQLNEAVRILKEEVLPVYERLSLRRELVIGRAKLALTYLARQEPGDPELAIPLLRAAYNEAQARGLPETDPIQEILRSAGWTE